MAELQMEDIEDVGLARTNPALVQIVQAMNDELAAKGYTLTVTGGARSEEHNAEVNGDPHSKHLTGNAVDLDADVPDGLLEEIAERHGVSYLWHDAGTGMHFHMQLDDDYEPVQPESVPTSYTSLAALTSGAGTTGGVLPEHDELPEDALDYSTYHGEPETEKLGFLSALASNFWDSVSSTGSAYVVQSMYGGDIRNGWIYRPVSDDDVDYVKAMLPDDREAQEFCLMHGKDAQEVRWLVNQRLVDKKRRAEIERWRSETESTLAKGAVALAGAAGMLVDPMIVMPQLEALNGAKVLSVFGRSLQNAGKARQIVRAATKAILETGTEQALLQVADDSLRAGLGGEKLDYSVNAAVALVAGSALRTYGLMRRDNASDAVVTALEKTETQAIASVITPPEKTAPVGLQRAMGRRPYRRLVHTLDKEIANPASDLAAIGKRLGTTDAMTVLREAAWTGKVPKKILRKLEAHEHIRAKAEGRAPVIRSDADAVEWLKTQDLSPRQEIPIGETGSETYKFAASLHDAELAKKFNAPILDRLQKTGRVVVTNAEHAGQLLEKMSGKKLPANAKAFYVPNEDYAFLLADRVKPEEVSGVLAHEFAVHGGLRKTLGDEAYQKLMERVHTQANTPGTKAYKARQAIASHEPEEILAHLIETNQLSSRMTERLRGLFNKAHKADGLTFTKDDVKAILSERLDAAREAAAGVHYNEDGSTAFAGIQFSKDSLLNPRLWDDLFELEDVVVRKTQEGWLLSHVPDAMKPRVGRFTKMLEQGYFGHAYTSASNTMRGLAGKLWEDARGRGAARANTMAAETHKEMLKKQLYRHILSYVDARTEALGQLTGRFSREKALAFDKEVMRYYNAHYGGNVAGGLAEDAPEGVKKAAAILDEYRKTQIDLGKRSSELVGSQYGNLIEKEWEPVDMELWRHIDKDAQRRLLNHGNTAEERAALEACLQEYARRFAKRDVIRKQLEREGQMAVQRAHAKGETAVAVPVTNDLIEDYIERESDRWAKECLDITDGAHDIQSASAVDLDRGSLGDLPFFRKRLSVDTSGVMEFNVGGNRFEFSFDNDLRDFDLTKILQQNAERFSGEAAVKAVFGSQQQMAIALKRIKEEIATAAAAGHSPNDWEYDFQTFTEGLKELRGMRSKDDMMTRATATARFLQNLSYAKNGANMLWAQLAEAGGSMAYGGVGRVFDVFPPLRRFVNDLEYGKLNANFLRESEDMMFGMAQEAQIYGTSYGDRMVREQLTSGSLIDRMLVGANDFAANLGKITSTVNMLPMVTESMMRGMRAQTLMDCVRWAEGKTFGKYRNPFTEAKLKAARLSEGNVNLLKEHLNRYVQKDADGNCLRMDVEAWQRENPVTYTQLWNLVQNQAERAIVSGTRAGNRNLLKNTNVFTRLMFQFKDYTLRAINGQTLRALTAGDVDDAVAAGLSVVTNTLTWGARIGATYQLMKAAGLTDKAEAYRQRMFTDGNLMRVIATRSTIIGSPLSLGNDLLEVVNPEWGTIRTSVDRPYYADRTFDVSDRLGDFITQMPAVKEGTIIPVQAAQAAYHAGAGRATQRDVMQGLKLLPIPNLIPVDVFYKMLAESSGLPTRRASQTTRRVPRKRKPRQKP